MYYLFLLASKIIPVLPDRFLDILARCLGWIAWLVATKARKQAMQNMQHVLGAQMLDTLPGRRRLRRVVQRMFYNNVLNYLAMFSLPAHRPEHILRQVHIEGKEHLEAALALGKGVILSSAHVGPFNYLFQWIVVSGYDLSIPVEPLKDRRMLALVSKLRGNHGTHILPLRGSATMRTIFHKLRENKIVLITADRAVEGQKSEMPFFGATALLPVGIAQLAKRTGAPVVGAYGWRTRNGKMHGCFFPLSLALPDEQRMNTDELQRAIIKLLEQNISEHPDNWLAFAPIWIERPVRAYQDMVMMNS